MRCLIFLLSWLIMHLAYADTIDHYMNIANNIPQMEMKADSQAQAWARSARNVLMITAESIAETLLQANELAKSEGKPLFCLPPGKQLSSMLMNDIIVQTYRDISSQQSDKDKMTVSQVAWLGVTKTFPCKNEGAIQASNPSSPSNKMEHMNSLLGLQ